VRLLLALALGLCAVPPAAAQQGPAKPKLAIVIHAEGLTSDLFQRHQASLAGGLGRLARGTVFVNAASVDAGEDGLAAAFGQGAVKAAVGGSPSTATGFDHFWTWDGRKFTGRLGQPQARIVPVGNEAIARLIGRAEPALTVPPACAASTASPRFARAAGDSSAFSSSPALDAATLAIGAGLVGELRMGLDSTTDLLVLRLPVTGRVVQAYGAGSQASCLQMFSLDRDLAGFFLQLDRGAIDYVVALAGSAPQGQAAPLIFWRAGMAAMNIDLAVSTRDLEPTIAAWLNAPIAAPGSGGRCLTQVAGTACPR
jgi:hypothetical protein